MNKKTLRNFNRLLLELALAIVLALFARSLSVAHADDVDVTNINCSRGLPALPATPPDTDTGIAVTLPACVTDPIDRETTEPR